MAISYQAVHSALTSESLDEKFEECLRYWEQGTTEQRSELQEWVDELRVEFLKTLEVIPDHDELETKLAVGYIEFKSRWIMLNTQIQYQYFREQLPDPEMTFRASLLSYLIETLEHLLPGGDIDTINEFLFNPINSQYD